MSSPHPKLGRESRHVPNGRAESGGPPHLSPTAEFPKDPPLTWDELRRIVANKEFHRLRRSEGQQRRYEAYQKRVQKSWKSVYDHV